MCLQRKSKTLFILWIWEDFEKPTDAVIDDINLRAVHPTPPYST